MRNYFIPIVLISCVFFVACKKGHLPKEGDSRVSLTFKEKQDEYHGNMSNGSYRGVKLDRVPTVDRYNVFQYFLRAGKDEQNYLVIMFSGPAPLTSDNIKQIEYEGMKYIHNGETFHFEKQFCIVEFKVEKKHYISGSFFGLNQSPTGERNVLSGGLSNIPQR